MNKIQLYSIVIIATLLGACNSDYLDTAPTDAVGSKTATATTENSYKALNGIAREMSSQHYSYSQGAAGENKIYAHYENYASENYLFNRYAAGWADLHNMKLFLNNQISYDNYAWYYYYQLIGSANSILAGIDEATGPDNEKAFVKASALTFRAYSYEKLTRYYCYRWTDSNNGASEGLPLRLDESEGDLPKSTLAETFAQIYKDCQEAIKLFESSNFDRGDDVWIPNKNVAHAVYARAALSRHDYATARAQAKLAKVGYPLMSNDDYKAGFAAPTSEWIFGAFGASSENNWYWSYGTQFACNGYYATKADTGAGQIGRQLINRIPNNDVRKSLFITEDKFPSLDWTDPNTLNPTYAYIGINASADGIANPAAWKAVADYVSSMKPSGFTDPYSAGFMYLGGHLKFWVTDMPGVSYLPFIRTSEMVLIEAEAAYQSGDEAGAKAALIELNKTSGRNPEYECNKSGEALWNEIMDYREVELWGEGSAWSDYKRWGRAIDRKSIADGGNAHAAVAVRINPDDANKWTWVTPQLETDFNGAIK